MSSSFNPDAYRHCVTSVTGKMLRHPLITADPKMEGRLGHAYCVVSLDEPNPNIKVVDIVGEILDQERRNTVMDFGQEKPIRLFGYPGLPSSYLCRNEEQKQYGGAIRGVRFLHAASAYPQDLDEAVSFATAIRYGDLLREQAEAYFEFRRSVTEMRLKNGLVVPVEPNRFASVLVDLL